MRKYSRPAARRIALAAQGFNDSRPAGKATTRHFRRSLDRMQILQLDSVNVVCRSHYLPLFSRIGNYDRDKLDHWLWKSRENLEYVGHEASITPVSTRPLLAHRFAENRWGRGKLEEQQPDYVQAVLDEVRQKGAMSVRDLSNPGDRVGPWWGGPVGKKALEWLYTTGRLGICHRDRNFVTHYDLPERLLPESVLAAPSLPRPEAQKEMLLIAARAHGVGTAADLADYFRIRIPEARPLLKELAADRMLETVCVEGWKDEAYLHPEAVTPRRIRARTLLTPFDPIVWFRPRARRLFDFEYKIEIYTPAEKRVYGYYVLPFLMDDRLVARVDVKADRTRGTLLAKASFSEPEIDREHVAGHLASALQEFAAFLGLEDVDVGRRGNLSRFVSRAMNG